MSDLPLPTSDLPKPSVATVDDLKALETRLMAALGKPQALAQVASTPVAPSAPLPATPGLIARFDAWVSGLWTSLKAKVAGTVVAPIVNAASAVAAYVGHPATWLRGFRTIIVFGATGTLGLIDAFNQVDLQSLVGLNVKLGTIVTLMSVLAILLRLITSTPMFKRWQEAGQEAAQPTP